MLDTNILLVSVSQKSKSKWLLDAIEEQLFELAYTTEVLAEYEEKFAEHWNTEAAQGTIEIILGLPNAIATTVYYHLNLIAHDKDDNKFVDCAFASNADYLVTNDADFNVLKTIQFPIIHVVSLDEFKQILIDRNLINP